MKREQKLIAVLGVGAAALFFLIALCVAGGEDERASEPDPDLDLDLDLEIPLVAEPAPEPQEPLSVEEPQTVGLFEAEALRSFEKAIQSDWLPKESAAAEDEPRVQPVAVKEEAEPLLAEEPPEEKSPEGPAYYVVKPGETYCSIAKAVYGSARYFLDIELANGIEPHRLRAGQRIAIPHVEGAQLNLPQKAPELREPKAEEYTIQPGDTLGHISLKLYGTSRLWKKLIEANPTLKPRKLVPGMTIAVPRVELPR